MNFSSKLKNNNALLVVFDQLLNSTITASVPFVIINYLGEDLMVEFVFVQSLMIYYVSIIESLLISPYYYLILKDKIKFSETIFTLSFILSIISICVILVVEIFYNLPLFIFLFYVTNVLKRFSINKNISEMNTKENIKNSLIYFSFYWLNILLMSLEMVSINVFIVLTLLNLIYLFNEIKLLKLNQKLNYSFIMQSFNIGKWSLYNMVIQLIITQIILFKLNNFSNKKAIIVYGLAITLTGVLNPIISSFNNYIISYVKSKLNYSKIKFRKLIYKINFIYIAILISLSLFVVMIFPIIEEIFIKEKFEGLYLVFLFILLSLIFKSDNQFNSRVITLIYSRKIVFITGLISLFFIIFIFPINSFKWESWLVTSFLLSRISASLYSKYILIKRLNV